MTTQIQRILDVISEFKDISQAEIIELTDNPSGINFSARLVGMTQKGLVTRKQVLNPKNGRPMWVYTATGKKYKPIKGRKPKSIKPEKTITDEFCSQLRLEVEELREWKRRALIACPQLNVDPLVYKAREIFARHTDDKKLKDDIYSGKLDKRPPMLALLEVLENGS